VALAPSSSWARTNSHPGGVAGRGRRRLHSAHRNSPPTTSIHIGKTSVVHLQLEIISSSIRPHPYPV